MTEVETEGEEQGVTDGGGDGGAKKGKDRGFDAVALRELRRARKLVKDGEPTPEAHFAVASANVLALLDLAAAIRGRDEDADAGI
jgi:hypothetical protein